ncbi:transporter substrate-binding domain-containing protein [Fluviispira vulneris]|uniref:transporter substrate-binding domain-containing protein n=1 Tax=Fluviispira vulneris TaxID=2763012 RepID=UPI001645902C|nr:transporter substrate-binding domain-containing protein [Fluviispira vulneris]
MFLRLLYKISVIFFMFYLNNYSNAQMLIHHNLSASQNDSSLSYELALLTLLLEKSTDKYGSFQLIKAEASSQSRAFLELKNNSQNIDVIATMTSISREEDAEPIRICIFKGLLGVRIPMVLTENNEKFENIKTAKELQKVSIGQVFDWPDTEILLKNNMNVIKATSYPVLYPMLKSRRFDLFPLGALEVFPIAESHAKEFGLTVIKKWAMVYPTGYYFFVSKLNKKLQQRLKYGFEKILQDGSFENIFNKFNAQYLQTANLNNRKLIFLKNPLLPKKTPIENEKLWYPLIWQGIRSIN